MNINILFYLLLSTSFLVVQSLRCQCTPGVGKVECHATWCQVFNTQDKVGVCAMVRMGTRQAFACLRLNRDLDGSRCRVESRNGTEGTVCWCKDSDYCNVDLADRVSDNSEDSDNNMIVENVYEEEKPMNRTTSKLFESDEIYELSEEVSEKAEERTREEEVEEEEKEEEKDIKPWRRINPENSRNNWIPPPLPPMPSKINQMPPTTSSSTTTTTTTTTIKPRLSYEEEMKKYEEELRKRRIEHEMELKRRLEERKKIELQYSANRRFGETRQQWPVPNIINNPTTTSTARIPTTITTTTTEATTTTTTMSSTTTTTTTTEPYRTTITTTTRRPIITLSMNRTSSYSDYYRNKYPSFRRPFDLNPTTPVVISNVNAIVYPPRNFKKATKGTITNTTTTTTTTTTPSTTTSTTSTTTTTTERPSTTSTTTEIPTITTTTMRRPSIEERRVPNLEKVINDDLIRLQNPDSNKEKMENKTINIKTSVKKIEDDKDCGNSFNIFFLSFITILFSFRFI